MRENAAKTKKQNVLVSPVMVMGAGFRCLAFRGDDGKLRNFWTQALVPLPVHILDPEN